MNPAFGSSSCEAVSNKTLEGIFGEAGLPVMTHRFDGRLRSCLKFLTILKRFAYAHLYSRRKEFQGVHELAALGSLPRPCSSKLGMALGLIERLNFQGAGSGFCLPIGGYFGSRLSDAR